MPQHCTRSSSTASIARALRAGDVGARLRRRGARPERERTSVGPRQPPQPQMMPVSVNKSFLLREPSPCDPAAEITIQPLIWHSQSSCFQSVSLSGGVFFHRHRCVCGPRSCPRPLRLRPSDADASHNQHARAKIDRSALDSPSSRLGVLGGISGMGPGRVTPFSGTGRVQPFLVEVVAGCQGREMQRRTN